ncbi:sushi, von Willebrand factor type A, EGF and pentraxin domain-containing protein 1-like [Schistocerca serialis cubense]|uniref:sushi, von Willebrand factor type A, EGF and pentraxin domain-containing protein 1-like n=1 Tax=Schistocerca serialis cubense TaxID=2023355 RepID=UPI00214ED834|nr:sushi, von Willebrand factor type A, EGF and pentraxin domain-containing protein 1-like [Schistocerca serialis cubense]
MNKESLLEKAIDVIAGNRSHNNNNMMNAVACLFFFTVVSNGVCGLDLSRRNKTELFRRIISAECAEFGEVVHGTVSKINATSVQGVHIECDEGYDLTGGPKVLCNDGRWDAAPRPMCAKRCKPPPLLRDGGVSVEARQDGPNSYRHGTKAIYSCGVGFQLSPPGSHIRSCHDGVWTGLAATCVSNGCPPPPSVADGYHVLEPLSPAAVPVVPHTDHEGRIVVSVEQRVHYSCNVGYTLQGPASLQCLASGQWNPRQPPKCVRQYGPPTEPPPPPPPPLPGMDMDTDKERISAHVAPELPLPVCPPAPTLHHTQVSVLDGPQTANNAGSGARLEVRCREGYRDPAAPCVPAVLYCEQGSWVGSLPICEPVSDCPPPPYVQHGTLTPLPPRESSYPVGSSVSYSCGTGYFLEGERTLTCAATGCWEPATLPSCKLEEQLYALAGCPPPPLVEHSTMSSPTSETSYPVGSSVSYSCFQGYMLEGEHIITCNPSGLWEPSLLPTCRADPQPYAYLSTSSVLLVSLAVALGVSLILLVVCVVVVCRHQGPKTRPGVPSPSSSTGGGGGHRGGCGGPPGSLGGPRHSSPTGCVATSGGVLHDPDRVALIAFADGVQLGESTALPTYEEAVRGCDRSMAGVGGTVGGGGTSLSAGGGQGHRGHGRGHWAGLGSGRRPVHVTRQSSSTSHTASLRSGSAAGDSMGSTDTMTPSEVSTTVTLDTVSSHTCSSGVSGSGSGSGGAASCRAICGSLASFDTSSALNTEGVPLLEESELEEADLSGPCKRRRPSPDPPGVA